MMQSGSALCKLSAFSKIKELKADCANCRGMDPLQFALAAGAEL
jgi:hypothetical protein